MKKIIIILCFSGALNAFQSVDINHASAGQIAELPGVGLKLAKNLLNYRQKNGLFREESELLAVPGMKPNKLKKLSGKIVFLGSKKKQPSKHLTPVIQTTSLKAKPMMALANLEKIVLKYQGLGNDLEADMLSRARRSALMPHVTIIFDFERDVDISEKKITNNTNTVINRGGRDLGFGIKAAFDLQELIFHKKELDIASLALKRLEKREKVLEKLRETYLNYSRFQKAGQEPAPHDEIEKIASQLKELSAILDSMSAGAFSAYQEQAGP